MLSKGPKVWPDAAMWHGAEKHALPLTYQSTADKLAAHGNAAGTSFKRIIAQSIIGIKLVQRYGGEGTCRLTFSRGAQEAIALRH